MISAKVVKVMAKLQGFNVKNIYEYCMHSVSLESVKLYGPHSESSEIWIITKDSDVWQTYNMMVPCKNHLKWYLQASWKIFE